MIYGGPMTGFDKLIKWAVFLVAATTAVKTIREIHVGRLNKPAPCCSSCATGKTCGSP